MSKEQYAKLLASENGKKVQQVLLEGKGKAAELWKEIQPQVVAALTTAQVCRKQILKSLLHNRPTDVVNLR